MFLLTGIHNNWVREGQISWTNERLKDWPIVLVNDQQIFTYNLPLQELRQKDKSTPNLPIWDMKQITQLAWGISIRTIFILTGKQNQWWKQAFKLKTIWQNNLNLPKRKFHLSSKSREMSLHQGYMRFWLS